MNFGTLKGLIENLIKNFMCPACNSNIKESSIEIVGAAGTSVNMDIECPSCKKHALIKAEIAYADMNAAKEKLEAIKGILKGMGTEASKHIKESSTQTVTPIDDANIVKLSQNLKSKNLSVSDLFSNQEEK